MIPREEEKYYAFSLSYSYSYSYDSNNDKGSHEITGRSDAFMPEHDDETNTESETKALVDAETAPDNSNSMEDISPATIVSVKTDDSKIEIVSSVDASSNGESNAANATITLLKSEAVSAESNDMENTSFFAKTIIGAGFGCAAVAALLLFKKRQRQIMIVEHE